MEIAKLELAALAQTIEKNASPDVIELAELQLALVGGGVASHPRLDHLKGSPRMEIAKLELAALAQTIEKNASPEVIELAELQLTLIGGGVGEVILV